MTQRQIISAACNFIDFLGRDFTIVHKKTGAYYLHDSLVKDFREYINEENKDEL